MSTLEVIDGNAPDPTLIYNPQPLEPPVDVPAAELLRQSTRTRRRRNGIAPGALKLLRVWRIDGGICHLCGYRVPEPFVEPWHSTEIRATLDHLVPASKGGGNGVENLRLAHSCCNNDRGVRRAMKPLKLELKAKMIARILSGAFDGFDWDDTTEANGPEDRKEETG